MRNASEESIPFQVRPSAISFNEGPPQVVVYLEHLSEALAYVRNNQIASIEVDTHASQASPLQIDFGFLNDLPDLSGFECRINISKKTDIGPLHKLKKLRQLAWPARTTPEVNLSCFPDLECLSFRHIPSTKGWVNLSKLRYLRLSVSKHNDLGFLENLKSLTKLEVADSSVESLTGIENLDHLAELEIFTSHKLIDISSVAKCKNLKYFYADQTKSLTDFSALAESKSIEILKLRSPIDSVEFVPRMKSLKNFFCNVINSDDLSPLLRAKSLKYLAIYPEKRRYTHKVADIKQSLGI